MAKWLTSLILVLTLCAGVLAGMPLHTGEQECNMPGMNGEMDCCKEARSQEDTKESTSARLCCVLNCPQSGTTEPTSARVIRVQTPLIVALHPAALQPPVAIPSAFYSSWAHSPPQNSNPAYIRHLALLI